MLKDSPAFSSFSVNDLAAAKRFYGETLGLTVHEEIGMGLDIKLAAGSGGLFIYPKDDHMPATFTVLNFQVQDIEKTVDELTSRGVTFERYDQGIIHTDEKGIFRGRAVSHGPDIAWFKDPAGNILSLVQE